MRLAPRQYRPALGADYVFAAQDVQIQSLTRQQPDFGNRILVSGQGQASGLSVTVVPVDETDQCVVADGESTIRVLASVLDKDGELVPEGTIVHWSVSAGSLLYQESAIQTLSRSETVQASNYTTVRLSLPASSIVGVYARKDTAKTLNLYTARRGSLNGKEITFATPLDYFDQALVVDYLLLAAPNTWQAGHQPGEAVVTAAVAGAQGSCVLHQSDPTACRTQIKLEAIPSDACLGEPVTIVLKAIMFGGSGVGAAEFGIQGCGRLSSTRKTLTAHALTEKLKTTIWGGAAEVRLSAMPSSGPISITATEDGPNLYASHQGQTVILSDAGILPGTQVTASYTAGGTTAINWIPADIPAGNEAIQEMLPVTHVEIEGITKAQVALSRTPVGNIICVPTLKITDFYESHEEKIVTLTDDSFTNAPLPEGHLVKCTYEAVWGTQPGCSAIITVRVADGSEDGGRGQIAVSARDCREPDANDETIPDEEGEEDPTEIPPSGGGSDGGEEDEIDPLACDPKSINARTPVPNKDNWDAVSGVASADDCPGICSCDEICSALRSAGKLAQAGLYWSQCMDRCARARDAQCTPCSLSGPTILNPGEVGTWVDNRGNNGDPSGDLTLVSRTPQEGYKWRMPSGGEGPFTVRVCYGSDAQQCCEAQVDFPLCTLSGPSRLGPKDEGKYVPSLGMAGATATVIDMEEPRRTDEAFVTKLKPGACEGSIAVHFGVRLCGQIRVQSTLQGVTGTVAGPSLLEPGETAYYAFGLDAALKPKYAGTLRFLSGGNKGAVLMMPPDAQPGETYTAKWVGICGASASLDVVYADTGASCSGDSPCEYGSGGCAGEIPFGGYLCIEGKVGKITSLHYGYPGWRCVGGEGRWGWGRYGGDGAWVASYCSCIGSCGNSYLIRFTNE